MPEKEKNLEKKLKRETEKLGGWCIKFLPFSLNGFPDRVCLFSGGRILFVELKSEGEKPRKLQALMHRKLERLGFRVEIVDSTEKLNQILLDYADKNRKKTQG